MKGLTLVKVGDTWIAPQKGLTLVKVGDTWIAPQDVVSVVRTINGCTVLLRGGHEVDLGSEPDAFVHEMAEKFRKAMGIPESPKATVGSAEATAELHGLLRKAYYQGYAAADNGAEPDFEAWLAANR